MTFPGHGRLADSWWGATAPTTKNTGTTNTAVGLLLTCNVPGRIFGLRAYADGSFDPVVYGCLSVFGGDLVRCAVFGSIAGMGQKWQQTWFKPTFRVNTGDTYSIGVFFGGGHFSRTN